MLTSMSAIISAQKKAPLPHCSWPWLWPHPCPSEQYQLSPVPLVFLDQVALQGSSHVYQFGELKNAYKHFQVSHSNERPVRRVAGVFLNHRNQSWRTSSWLGHPTLVGQCRIIRRSSCCTGFYPGNAMCSGITEHSLKGKTKAYSLEWLRALLVASQGSYHSLNLPFPPAKSQLHRTTRIEL